MTHNYLNEVLAESRADTSVDRILSGDKLAERAENIARCATDMRLIRLTPSERDRTGPESSLEELDLNQRYADVTDAVPELLDALGLPRDTMRSAVQMEQALSQVAGVASKLQETSGAGVVLLAAELTAMVDRVGDAAAAMGQAGAEETRDEALLAFQQVDWIREETAQQAADRAARRARRQERLSAYQEALLREQEVLTKAAALKDAPLPTPGKAALPGKP